MVCQCSTELAFLYLLSIGPCLVSRKRYSTTITAQRNSPKQRPVVIFLPIGASVKMSPSKPFCYWPTFEGYKKTSPAMWCISAHSSYCLISYHLPTYHGWSLPPQKWWGSCISGKPRPLKQMSPLTRLSVAELEDLIETVAKEQYTRRCNGYRANRKKANL